MNGQLGLLGRIRSQQEIIKQLRCPNAGQSAVFQVMKRNILGVINWESVAWVLSLNVCVSSCFFNQQGYISGFTGSFSHGSMSRAENGHLNNYMIRGSAEWRLPLNTRNIVPGRWYRSLTCRPLLSFLGLHLVLRPHVAEVHVMKIDKVA